MAESSRELCDGVWWLDLGTVNAYLVDDGGVLTLVDAGTPGDADEIRAGIRGAGFEPDDVERVLVTHYDFDHVGALRVFDDAEIYAGEGEAALVTGEREPALFDLKGFIQRVTAFFLERPDGPVLGVEDGESVGSFTVYETPGHTSDHVAYASEALDVVFVGDLVREEGEALVSSPWFLNADSEAVGASIHSLADRLPEISVVAPGHGTPLTDEGWRALAEIAEKQEQMDASTVLFGGSQAE